MNCCTSFTNKLDSLAHDCNWRLIETLAHSTHLARSLTHTQSELFILLFFFIVIFLHFGFFSSSFSPSHLAWNQLHTLLSLDMKAHVNRNHKHKAPMERKREKELFQWVKWSIEKKQKLPVDVSWTNAFTRLKVNLQTDEAWGYDDTNDWRGDTFTKEKKRNREEKTKLFCMPRVSWPCPVQWILFKWGQGWRSMTSDTLDLLAGVEYHWCS